MSRNARNSLAMFCGITVCLGFLWCGMELWARDEESFAMCHAFLTIIAAVGYGINIAFVIGD